MDIKEKITELFWNHPTKIVFTLGFLAGAAFVSLL